MRQSKKQKDIKERYSVLDHTKRLSSELLFMISHQVRKPVCSLLGLLPILEKLVGGSKEPEIKKVIDYLQSSCNELDQNTAMLSKLLSEKRSGEQDQISYRRDGVEL